VREKATERRLIEAAQGVAAAGYGEHGDAAEYLEQSEKAILDVTQRAQRSGYERAGALVRSTLRAFEERSERREAITGIPSGFDRLDRYTSGWQRGDLVIIAARPSMGKTALGMNCAEHAAICCRVPVLVFSVEMAKLALLGRMICSVGRVDHSRFRCGVAQPEDHVRVHKAASTISEIPLWIDDEGGITLRDIRAKARRWRANRNEGGALATETDPGNALVVVDYIQRVHVEQRRGREQNREREVAEISDGLKNLAKELRLPVLALSQLSRAVESRTDKRPQMSDLRDSGALEQDGDVIAFLYRDQVYNKQSEARGTAEIIIGKQRNGMLGTARLAFLENYVRFDNLPDDHQQALPAPSEGDDA
jgi:replicative DNA helicase